MLRFIESLFRFCASLKLAVLTILALAALLALATFYEAHYGGPPAQAQIYGSPLFLAVLALLAINVMAAALIRFPWTKKQTGFVVTHVGILTLLAGSLITYRTSIEGRLTLSPGQTATDYALADERLQLQLQGQTYTLPAPNWTLAGYPPLYRALLPNWPPAPTAPQSPTPTPNSQIETPLAPGVSLRLLQWLPAARKAADNTYTTARVKPAALPNADRAALVQLTVDGQSASLWLPRGADAQLLPTPRGPALLAYGFVAANLPAPITLLSARRLTNPGTNDPAAYEAVLQTNDGQSHTLTLNNPLTLSGHTLYLSSLDDSNPNEPKATLALRKDPGTPIKYTGALLLSTGIFLMFYMKAYFQKPQPAPRTTGFQPVPSGPSKLRSPIQTLLLLLLPLLLLTTPAQAQPATTAPQPAIPNSQSQIPNPKSQIRNPQSAIPSNPYLPVLDAGRIKPLDTAAREAARLLTGREVFQGHDPLTLILDIQRNPTDWANRPLLHVPLIELRNLLGLTASESSGGGSGGGQYVAPEMLRASLSFRTLVTTAAAKRAQAEQLKEEPTLSRLESAALDLADRLALFDSLSAGHHFHYITNPVDPAPLQREVAYNRLHPFRIAWITYLAALLTLCLSLLTRPRLVYRLGLTLLLDGIALSALAFAWRCSITGWAPVTNIYETVIWVAFVGSIVAVAIELRSRDALPAIAGAIAATFAGVIADTMPPEYGSAVKSLTPVLRSNLWLTIHVLTIVSSYAAFLIATVLANIALYQFAFPKPHPPSATSDTPHPPSPIPHLTSNISHLTSPPPTLSHLYRSLQLGTLLIATGTLLGGLWADVSWGRFWGWDPKETWALIILLTYLALLHARYTRWLTPFGLATGSVLAFLTVLMSWYGVNFLLGTGLHSYGFQSGGEPYIATYTLAQLTYLAICTLRHNRLQKHAFTLPTPTTP